MQHSVILKYARRTDASRIRNEDTVVVYQLAANSFPIDAGKFLLHSMASLVAVFGTCKYNA